MIKNISTIKPLLIDIPSVLLEDIRNHDAPLTSTSSSHASSTEHIQKITDLYASYKEALYLYAVARVSTKEKAQDVVQETFTRVWQYIIEGNSILHEKSFLYTTAHHLIIDEYRKKKSISLEGIMNTYEEPSITLEEAIIDTVELSHVMDCINKLPPMYRSVLTLRFSG